MLAPIIAILAILPPLNAVPQANPPGGQRPAAKPPDGKAKDFQVQVDGYRISPTRFSRMAMLEYSFGGSTREAGVHRQDTIFLTVTADSGDVFQVEGVEDVNIETDRGNTTAIAAPAIHGGLPGRPNPSTEVRLTIPALPAGSRKIKTLSGELSIRPKSQHKTVSIPVAGKTFPISQKVDSVDVTVKSLSKLDSGYILIEFTVAYAEGTSLQDTRGINHLSPEVKFKSGLSTTSTSFGTNGSGVIGRFTIDGHYRVRTPQPDDTIETFLLDVIIPSKDIKHIPFTIKNLPIQEFPVIE